MTVDDLRRKLSDEYGEERFTMTASEIERRAGRAPRRRLVVWATVTAAVVAVTGFLVWPKGPAHDVEPLATPGATPSALPSWDPVTMARFAENCEQKWREQDHSALQPQDRGQLPPLRLEASEGQLGIRVYANERVIAECERDADSTSVGFTYADGPGEQLMPDGGAAIPRYGAIANLGDTPNDNASADYYIGRVPTGVTRIDAVGRQGQLTDALLDGDLFLLWAPRGGLHHAIVRAYAGDRVIMEASPLHPDGAERDVPADQQCAAIAADYTARAGTPALPPRRFRLIVENDSAVLLYATDGAVAACEHRVGSVFMTSVSRPLGGAPWGPLHHFHRGGEGDGWVLGVAPPGARSGTVTVTGGRKVALQFAGGWFAARWTGVGVQYGAPEQIEILTDTEVWATDGNAVTHRSR